MIVLTGQSLHPAGLRFLAVWGSGVRGRGSETGLRREPTQGGQYPTLAYQALLFCRFLL